MKFLVKDSKVGGKGVFATEKIHKGEFIHALVGEFITEEQFLGRFNSGGETYDDPFQIQDGEKIGDGEREEERRYIDLDELSRTFNHSCNPNGGIHHLSDLFALRDINPGDEITYDYSTTVGPSEKEFSMTCKCGEKNCRHTITNVTTISQDELKRYKRLNAFPDYVKRQLKNIIK